VKQATPEVKLDYVNRQFTGLIVGQTYTFNGPKRLADTETYPIPDNSGYNGIDVSIVRLGDATHIDSDTLVLYVPLHPTMPAITVTQPAVTTEKGIIAVDAPTVVTGATYEYRKGEASGGELGWGAWTDIPDTDKTDRIVTLGGIEGGRYVIRVKAVASALDEEGDVKTQGSFASLSRPFYIHAYDEVRFDAQLQGYKLPEADDSDAADDPLAPQAVTVDAGTTVAGVTWTNATEAEKMFTLTEGKDEDAGKWFIQPVEDLSPGTHEAQIEITFEGDTNDQVLNFIFTVHPKGVFRVADGAVITDKNNDGVSDTLTLNFKYPIVGTVTAAGLRYNEVIIDNAAVKTPGVTDFTKESNVAGNVSYEIPITLSSSRVKSGDKVRVRVARDRNGKFDIYQ
jgi:hypothetical protein